MDGHLWIIIPISEGAAATAAKGAGLHKPVQELIPDADPDNWRLRAAFYKFSRGFFKTAVWVCAVHISDKREQIFLGFIVATSLRQFAIDLRQMIEIGYPTFPTSVDAYDAVP